MRCSEAKHLSILGLQSQTQSLQLTQFMKAVIISLLQNWGTWSLITRHTASATLHNGLWQFSRAFWKFTWCDRNEYKIIHNRYTNKMKKKTSFHHESILPCPWLSLSKGTQTREDPWLYSSISPFRASFASLGSPEKYILTFLWTLGDQ